MKRRSMKLLGAAVVAIAAAVAGIGSATAAQAASAAPAASTVSAATPTTTVVSAAQAAKLGVHLKAGQELVHTNACVKPQPGARPGARPLLTTCAGAGHYAIKPAGTKATAAVVSPNTVSDDFCTSLEGYGWFGLEPGDSSDGGPANDLWITTASANNVTPLLLAAGNGQNTQQWCFIPLVDGSWNIAAYYKNSNLSTYEYECVDITNGAGVKFAAGTRLQAYPCNWQGYGGVAANQDWLVCSRSSTVGDDSFEPANSNPSSVWMDVFGGPGSKAFVSGNPLQIWTGNGADNQRFVLHVSPGSTDLYGFPVNPGC